MWAHHHEHLCETRGWIYWLGIKDTFCAIVFIFGVVRSYVAWCNSFLCWKLEKVI